MSTVFLESFDANNGNLTSKGWITGYNYPYPVVAGRTGNAINLPNGVLGNSLTYNLYGAAHQTVSCGLAVMLPTNPVSLPLIAFDGVAGVSISGLDLSCPLGPCGHLSIGAWHYVECLLTLGTGSSGFVEVRVDGVVTFSGPGNTGSAATTGSVVLCNWYGIFSQNAPTYLDDLYITNGAGTTNTGLLGDTRVVVQLPYTNGDLSQLENSNGNFTNNYSYVDSPVYQTSTFVASDTPGNEDTYNMADLPWPAGVVTAVQATILADKDNAATRYVKPLVRISGTDYVGTQTALSMSPEYALSLWDLNPATGLPWTITDVNDAQLGVRVE
jgi:hypothetical protein